MSEDVGSYLRAWEVHDRAAGSLLAEAVGWGERIDQSDDEAVLSWAREYLPRTLAHAEDAPKRSL